MQIYTAILAGEGQTIFSKFINPHAKGLEKKEREQPDAYDERIWPHKAHYQGDQVIIPRIMFKRALEDVAQYLGRQIPGKGKSTYTKHFKSGVHITTDLLTGFRQSELEHTVILCNADGVRGSGKRVMRNFPAISGWRGELQICVVDGIITKEVLRDHLVDAGRLVGVGSFRIMKGNSSGGFRVESLN